MTEDLPREANELEDVLRTALEPNRRLAARPAFRSELRERLIAEPPPPPAGGANSWRPWAGAALMAVAVVTGLLVYRSQDSAPLPVEPVGAPASSMPIRSSDGAPARAPNRPPNPNGESRPPVQAATPAGPVPASDSGPVSPDEAVIVPSDPDPNPPVAVPSAAHEQPPAPTDEPAPEEPVPSPTDEQGPAAPPTAPPTSTQPPPPQPRPTATPVEPTLP
jgi:hypothetical protein